MIVKLYYKGNEYDLTPYVDLTDNNINETIEEELDSGKIVLSRVAKDVFSGLDMSKRIPSLCKLYFDNEKEEEPRYFLTADTQCFEIIRGKRWKHEIGLIELTKELQLTPIRDMTITQPQDGNYYSASSARTLLSINNANETIFNGGAYDTFINVGGIETKITTTSINDNGLKITNGGKTANLTVIDQTNGSIIDGTTIKETGNYNISLSVSAYNPTFSISKEEKSGWGFDSGGAVGRCYKINPIIDIYLTKNGIEEKIGSKELAISPLVTTNASHGGVPLHYYFTNSISPSFESFNISLNENINADTELGILVKLQNNPTWRHSMTRYEIFYKEEKSVYYDNFAVLKDLTVNISKQTDAELEDSELPIRLDHTVKKIIRLSGIKLEISDTTLTRLNRHGTPENTFTRFTAWDALKEVGAIVGALPEIVINSDGDKELVFQYYSDMETDYVVVEPPNVQSVASARNLDNYVGALQLNADNIVSSNLSETSPYTQDYEANTTDEEIETDWLTLRAGSDGNVKITTDNIGIRLPNRIYQMRQVEIKGLDLNKMTGGDETTDGVLPYRSDYIWKLNDDEDQLRILEEKYWQTLEDNNDYADWTNRIETKKNNTIYYKQGDYRIYGMNFTAQFKPMVETDPDKTAGNRSIYEMLFTKAIKKSGINETQLDSILGVLKDPGTIEKDNKLKLRITYIPQDYSRATIYKEDLSGFEMPNVEKYYNETAIINDPLSLGVNAQDTINRLGNTVISYVGYAKPNEQLPFIGSKTADNKILTNINCNDRPYRTDYVASYVQDFSVISDYVGVKSPHRQYQIPSDGIVMALDKNKTHIFVDTQPIASTPTVWGNNIKEFFDFKAEKSKAPLFAEVSTYEFDSDYDSDTEKGLFIRPLTKTPTGRTINFKYQMDSNFSAGATKKKTEIGGEPVYWQEEVPYTTKFGRLYGAKVRLVKDVNKNAIITDPTVEDRYPKLDDNVVTDVYTDNKYIVDKDAREIMALSEEVAFHSNKVNDIILYDGIAKFNPMTLTDLSRNNIKIAIMNDDYKISKSAKKVNYAELQSVGESILNGITYTLHDNRIEFSLPAEAQGKGLVIYNDNVDSGDLVMIYLTEINGNETKTLYFGTKKLGE